MRLRILTLGQTDVYLHLGTLAFALYAWLTGSWPMLMAGFFSILLHECAHGAAAWLLGQPPREMEVTPMGAVLRLEDEERLLPLKRLVMLAAGPGMTLILCHFSLMLTAQGWLAPETGRRFFTANLAILLMNLLPALPLDGGRMLALMLSCILRQETVRRVMRTLGTVFGLAAIGISVWLSWRYGSWNWSLAAGGCFLLYSAAEATTTQALSELRRLMDRKSALEARGHAPCRSVVILSAQPLGRAVRLLTPRSMTDFAVTEPGTLRRLRVMSETEVISAWLAHPQMSCGEAVRMDAKNSKK